MERQTNSRAGTAANSRMRDGDEVDPRQLTPDPSELGEDDGSHHASPLALCALSFSPGFTSVRLQGRHDIVDAETGRVGVGQHAGDERAQPSIALARRVRLAWASH